MLKPRKRWKVHEINYVEVEEIAKNNGIHSIIASLLLSRGISKKEDIQRFLHKDDLAFHDPYLLDDMKKAVDRIQAAILKNEKILIYGDYDADGVTSTSIMYKTLKALNANFAYYIPNRFSEGYGLNPDALEKAAENGYKVVITVDTGISAIEEAEIAKDLDICLIITDHHQPPDILPDAYAIINPNKREDHYPFKSLAGVGVAFKLASALLGRPPLDFLDIVAIGTVSDLVPLIDENRVIVNHGLKRMKETKHIGLKVLLEDTGLIDKDVNAGHIGFIIGPRINASGRLDSAKHAVRLFITDEVDEAREVSKWLNDINQERQSLVEKITTEALKIIEEEKLTDNKVIIVASHDWNEGVIGIAASRILEKFYRPTIVLSIDSETGLAKGSARSIEGYDIYQALTSAKELLPSYGGHTAAAGLSIAMENIPALRSKLNALANEWLSDEDFIPIEKIDVVSKLEDINIDLVRQIEWLAPFGIGNPTPKILIEQVEISNILSMGNNNKHLKLNLQSKEKTMEALYFSRGDLKKEIATFSEAKLLGELSINEWNGEIKPQMIIKDMYIPDLQIFDWRNANWLEYLQELDKNSTCVIFKDIIDNFEEGWAIANYDQPLSLKENNIKSLILAEIPPTKEKLREILIEIPNLERIYCVFKNDKKNSFDQLIDRKYFKQIYVILKQNKALSDYKKAEQYFKHLGISSEIFKFILDVFIDLGFIIVKGEQIVLTPNPEKKDLEQSRLYKSYLEQEELKKLFLYSSHQMLRKWLINQYLG